MSRIYFHSPSETVEVLGSERAHLGLFTHEASIGFLLGAVGEFRLKKVLHPSSMAYEVVTARTSYRMLSTALGTFGDREPAFLHNGERVDHWELLLNTLILLGNDSVRLAARVHAQCEIHGYVEGEDRVWLAGLVRGARTDGVFRDGMGWESVIALLESRADEPVVMSYSVCDGFPNDTATTWVPPENDPDREAWYELSHEEQWRTGMEWLREHGGCLQPGKWSDYRFGHNLTVMDLATQPATATGGVKP
ncbi:hypothetical protein [Nocardia sp. NPDC051463]|uniref:hypothetical protein n=1 Tax=Nocardia sp. NPDC051463 TaxID=3154845 RepID=UPI00344B698D